AGVRVFDGVAVLEDAFRVIEQLLGGGHGRADDSRVRGVHGAATEASHRRYTRRMDFRDSPEEVALRERVRTWFERNLPPEWGTPAWVEPEGEERLRF